MLRHMSKNEKAKDAKLHGFIYYAMPWNLAKEISALGYPFGKKKIFAIYAIVIIIMIALGLIFKTPIAWLIPLVIAGLLFAPKLVQNSYKNKYELKRFSDVNVYIEQMLYAFKNSQKILTALMDVLILFPEGTMHTIIDKACEIISNPSLSEADENVEAKALNLIYQQYPNEQVKDLHRFLLSVESTGGNFDSSVELLLKNRAMWENRAHRLQDKRRAKKSEIVGSCVASMLLCISMLYILPDTVDISTIPIVRIGNLFMIIICIWIYTKADTKLATNLITPKKEQSDDMLLKSYRKYITYNPKKEFIKGLKWCIPPLIIIMVGVLFFNRNIWIIGVGGLLLLLMLFQHQIGHNLLGKRLKREVSHAFPQWLMQLALFLQSDNVQVSIFKSVESAPAILKPELINLREGLLLNPDASEPFLGFFKSFGMPDITTSMQMLYSLSSGLGGNADEQISNIVTRNSLILDRAEELANDNSLAGLNVLFLLPVIAGGAVLMIDMTMFLLSFMETIVV